MQPLVCAAGRSRPGKEQGNVIHNKTKEFVAVMTGRANHARKHGFHEAADLMDDMMRLASRGMTRLPMSLCAEEVSCPGPPTREEEEEEEDEEEEEEEEQEEEQEQEATASPQAADPDPGSIWDVQGDPVDPTRRIRCRR
jgi:hypothetical protein